MGEGVSRAEFQNLQKKVDGLDEKMTDLSERTIMGITELSGDVKGIAQLLKQSVADNKSTNVLCRSECNTLLSKVEETQDDIERRLRTQEVNWGKMTGIALAAGAASGIITGFVLKIIG